MNVINKEIMINAPRRVVWRYLESPDLLAAWLMRNSFEPVAGREFEFFAHPSETWDGVVQCRIVDLEPPAKISFTWNANNIGTDTLVTIELAEIGASTRVRLIHTNFEEAAHDVDAIVRRHDAGWDDHLRVLAIQAGEDAEEERKAPDIDWSEFSLYVAIDAKPAEVLSRWSTIEGMESFFVEMMRITGPDGCERSPSEPARVGDRYIWRWHSGRKLEGAYLAPENSDEVRFSFGESIVSVHALPYQDGALVRLRQYEIPDNEQARMHIHTNCRGGWVYFLTILKTLLECGVDGRDVTRETGASFSTHFSPRELAVGSEMTEV